MPCKYGEKQRTLYIRSTRSIRSYRENNFISTLVTSIVLLPLGQSLNIFPNLSLPIPGNETPNISKNGTMPQAPWLDNVEKKNSWVAGLKEQKS